VLCLRGSNFGERIIEVIRLLAGREEQEESAVESERVEKLAGPEDLRGGACLFSPSPSARIGSYQGFPWSLTLPSPLVDFFADHCFIGCQTAPSQYCMTWLVLLYIMSPSLPAGLVQAAAVPSCWKQ
jgi:hypothetical protein